MNRVGRLNSPELLEIVRAVAAIELDADFMRRKLRATGVLRFRTVRQYSDKWLSEEVDHGVAFSALVERLSGGTRTGLTPDEGALARDKRALLAFPAMWMARPFRRATLTGYFVRGMLVEGQAIVIYGRLARELGAAGESTGASIVRRITAQEGRHLRFFSKGAELLLGAGAPTFRRAVRQATALSFRPPGVDLFGRRRWAELLHPLLRDPEVMSELIAVDSRMAMLPGFEDCAIAGNWFRELFSDFPHLTQP